MQGSAKRGLPAGSSSASSRPRPLPTPAASCATWNAPVRCAAGHNLQPRFIPNMLWQGVHRPPVRPAQTCCHRPARVRQTRVRPVLRRPWHRAPPRPAFAPANQRQDRGGAAVAPFSFGRGVGNHAAPLCPALQPAEFPNQPWAATPLQTMKDWHKLKPELFSKQPYYLTGCDK